MGCMKSKQTFPFPSTIELDKRYDSNETFMTDERCLPGTHSPATKQVQQDGREGPGSNPVILKYAEQLAEEILQDALQQWARTNIKYYNIPYIENGSPNAVGDAPPIAVDGAGASLNT